MAKSFPVGCGQHDSVVFLDCLPVTGQRGQPSASTVFRLIVEGPSIDNLVELIQCTDRRAHLLRLDMLDSFLDMGRLEIALGVGQHCHVEVFEMREQFFSVNSPFALTILRVLLSRTG